MCILEEKYLPFQLFAFWQTKQNTGGFNCRSVIQSKYGHLARVADNMVCWVLILQQVQVFEFPAQQQLCISYLYQNYKKVELQLGLGLAINQLKQLELLKSEQKVKMDSRLPDQQPQGTLSFARWQCLFVTIRPSQIVFFCIFRLSTLSMKRIEAVLYWYVFTVDNAAGMCTPSALSTVCIDDHLYLEQQPLGRVGLRYNDTANLGVNLSSPYKH